MREYRIGRYPEADIVLTTSFCSRDHAMLTATDTGKYLLRDSSANGTLVNGRKVQNESVELKYGDEVLFAGVEKLDWSLIQKPESGIHKQAAAPKAIQKKKVIAEPFVPLSKKSLYILFGAIGIMLSFGLVILVLPKSNKKTEITISPADIYTRYQNSVAMVEVKYFIHIHTKANDLYFGKDANDSIGFDRDKNNLKAFTSEGTAFFIDSSGILITNHHVVEPWKHDKVIKDYFNTIIKPAIKRALIEKGWGTTDEPTWEGEMDAIAIYPNGKNYSSQSKIPCSVLKVSSSEEVDLAAIQIKSHSIPQNCTIISPDLIEPDPTKIIVGTPAYVIGFPLGDALAVNESNILNCTSTQGSFTQNPSVNYIQYSAQTASGGSGSPVFNQYGKLVAITYLGFTTGQNMNRGILSKHIKSVWPSP
jgi:S1-C subfamily serine protease